MMRFLIGFLVGYNAGAIGRFMRAAVTLVLVAWVISRVGFVGRMVGPVSIVGIIVMKLADRH